MEEEFYRQAGRHAAVVKKKEVTIVFEIVQLQSKPERAFFEAKDMAAPIFTPSFRAESPQDLERMWVTQTHDLCEAKEQTVGVEINGARFVGFRNLNFVNYFRANTPDFVREVEAVEPDESIGGGWFHDEIPGERQHRRRVCNMFPAFRNALSRGGKDEQEAFRLLIQSRKFKSEFGDMLEREYGEKNAQGLVEAYKSCMNKGEKRQALLLLSTYSSCHPRSQTMSRFECSVRQVKNANMLWRLRHVPEDTKSVHKYTTFSRETVIHACTQPLVLVLARVLTWAELTTKSCIFHTSGFGFRQVLKSLCRRDGHENVWVELILGSLQTKSNS